jgi:riboflavin kinase / FMN adenylyltransferase
MRREIGLEQIVRDEATVVTVGTFDGLHVGHHAIVQYLVRRAQRRGAPSVVVTFDPHPREITEGALVPLLTTVDERARVLEKFEIDRFIVIPFTPAFAALPAEDFVQQVLVERIGMCEIVIGYDHGFGRGRRGNRRLLEDLGALHGFDVDVIPPQEVGTRVVSSSKIRRSLLETGDVEAAAAMLGRSYTMDGLVVQGAGRGHDLGYPTANLQPVHPHKVVPREGVYAVTVKRLSTGASFGGMMNIGRRPTFDGKTSRLEVHLFEFSGRLYGETLRIAFVERLRDEQKFDSVGALIEQLSIDEARCRRRLGFIS